MLFCRTVSSISIEKSEPATEGPAAEGPTNIEESTSSAVLEAPTTPDRESEDIAGTSSQQNAPKTTIERVRPPPGKAKKRKMDPVDEKLLDYLESKAKKTPIEQCSDQQFLNSLLPDLQGLEGQTKLVTKIKIMEVLIDAKKNQSPSTSIEEQSS